MLLEKKAEHQSGGIDKNQYFRDMFEIHKHLFEYPELIKNSPLKSIMITEEQVVFTICSSGNEIKICCDERDAHALSMSYLNFAAYEPVETAMLLKLIKPGDVIFDIGANIGWYTLNALLAHKGTSVYSIEPIQSSYQYLVRNLALNGQDTSRAYNIGFSDENTKAKFYFDIQCAMASSMANLRENADTVTVECEVEKLDDFVTSMTSLKRLDLIKCDVEGSELFVFKGGIESIRKYKPIIFTEMLRKWSKKFGYHPNDIIDLFSGLGYDCYTINEDRIEKFGMVDDETVQTNYLFFHREKHEEMYTSWR